MSTSSIRRGSRGSPGTVAHTLLMLDAGLRSGEALGMRWGDVAWGADEDDPTRHLHVRVTRPRGGDPEPPKSGRTRRVGLSRRLRRALGHLHRDRFAPGPDAFVLARVHPRNFAAREWRRILKRAGIAHRAPKDLRDTFASQLLTAGVQLGYISTQLGHSDVQTTARHYARWCGDGAGYRDPLRLGPGELPADLLARLPRAESPRSPHTVDLVEDTEDKSCAVSVG